MASRASPGNSSHFNSFSSVQFLLDRIGFRLIAVFHNGGYFYAALAEKL
jgi:hypothetical protein